jgi:hypothetical protein
VSSSRQNPQTKRWGANNARREPMWHQRHMWAIWGALTGGRGTRYPRACSRACSRVQRCWVADNVACFVRILTGDGSCCRPSLGFSRLSSSYPWHGIFVFAVVLVGFRLAVCNLVGRGHLRWWSVHAFAWLSGSWRPAV